MRPPRISNLFAALSNPNGPFNIVGVSGFCAGGTATGLVDSLLGCSSSIISCWQQMRSSTANESPVQRFEAHFTTQASSSMFPDPHRWLVLQPMTREFFQFTGAAPLFSIPNGHSSKLHKRLIRCLLCAREAAASKMLAKV